MKAKIKKVRIVGLMLVFVMLFSCMGVFAEEPRYIPCPEGGKHIMSPIGLATCFEGYPPNAGKAQFSGTLSQCSQCSIFMVSQNYPGAVIKNLGKYAISSSIDYYDGVGSVYGGYIGIDLGQPDALIDGFDFRMRSLV